MVEEPVRDDVAGHGIAGIQVPDDPRGQLERVILMDNEIRLGRDGRYYVREKQPDGNFLDYGPYESPDEASRANRRRRAERDGT